MGRSEKALKNISTGLLNKAIVMFLSFATKTAFIRLLGAEYNGISSLFTNILSVLALAELGLGNVLMFYLYAALKEDDHEKIYALTQEFKRIYNIIILFILGVGLAVIPFLPSIVNSEFPFGQLVTYYLLYLINSVASYFVIYRTMVVRADQKEYILNNVNTGATVCMYLLQLVYLFVYRNFLGYLIIQVMCTIGNNIVQDRIALKRYPYLKKQPGGAVTNYVDKKKMFLDVKATFLFKVSDTVLDQTDNIIISIMFGTVVVGYYANYYMIMAYLAQIAAIIVSGLLAGFGNLYVDGDDEKSYQMLRCSMFFFSAYGAFTVACYSSIVQQFIPLWVGSQYVMGIDMVAAIMAVYYLRMVTNTVWIYRSTMGIFKEVQYINLLAAVLNIVLSVLFGHWFGVAGVIVATGVSRLFTSFWYEGKVVFEKLGKKASVYYKVQLKDLATSTLIIGGSLFVNRFLPAQGAVSMIGKVLVCAVLTLGLELVVNGRSEEFKSITGKVHSVFTK